MPARAAAAAAFAAAAAVRSSEATLERGLEFPFLERRSWWYTSTVVSGS